MGARCDGEIGRGVIAPLDQAQTAMYLESGRLASQTVQRLAQRAGITRAEIRFDGRNLRAEAWLRETSSGMITAINEDIREGIRSDNGSEFIALVVRDWIGAVGAKTAYIEPGSPWEIGCGERFNARFHDEILNIKVS